MPAPRHHVTIPSLPRLGRNAIPQILEGAVVPAALFIAADHVFGLAAGIVAALLWTLVGKLPDEVPADHRVHHFFRRASFAWAIVGFANAALTLWLLHAQTTSTYILVKPMMSVGLTVAVVAASVLWFKWSMTRHGFEIRTA